MAEVAEDKKSGRLQYCAGQLLGDFLLEVNRVSICALSGIEGDWGGVGTKVHGDSPEVTSSRS